MADQTSQIQQIAAATNAVDRINENFDAASPSMLYGRDARTTAGLTWGYVGGRWLGSLIASGTVTLSIGSTNYVVAHLTTGAVTTATTSTNWNDQGTYLRLYKITTGVSSVTGYEDHRQTYGAGGGMVNPMTAVGDLIRGGASGAPQRLAAGSNGQVLTLSSGVPAWVSPGAGSGLAAIPIACSDETSALSTGGAKVTFRMPYAMTLTEVRASLTTAQSSGSIFTVDINNGGASILSTKLTIDNGEKTSVTASTPAVISGSSLGDDSEITIDIDQIGNGSAAGLKVYLIGIV